jgi:hypothetical protein
MRPASTPGLNYLGVSSASALVKRVCTAALQLSRRIRLYNKGQYIGTLPTLQLPVYLEQTMNNFN